jgi:hypothetical protein
MNWHGPHTFTFDYRLPKCATPCTVQVSVFYRDETDTYCVMLEQVRIEHDSKIWSLTDVLSQEVMNTIDQEAQTIFATFLQKGQS